MARPAALALPDAQAEPDLSATGPADAVWNTAPIDRPLADQIRALTARLTPAQSLWLSGYLAGTLARVSDRPAGDGTQPASMPVTILFGSESGNSQRLAQQLADRLGARHVAHRVLDMAECRKADIEQAQRLVAIVSTHGDGDPPERAAPFFELLSGRRAPSTTQAQFAVLALGDSSYEHFCAAGRRLDARLEELGARRLLPRVDCDVEFESQAAAWMDTVAARLAEGAAVTAVPALAAVESTRPPARSWTRGNSFPAEILANHDLTARGSSKTVRHVELALRGSGLRHEPGDALGIVPRNDPAAADALIAQLGYAPDAPVVRAGTHTSLRAALFANCEIGTLSPAFVRRYADAIRYTELIHFAAQSDVLREYLWGRDVRDLVAEHPPRGLDAAAFVELLAPLAPRLYSIASSARATPDEVHLTVGVVAYESHGRARRGVVSGAMVDFTEGNTLPVYLHQNTGFRLPSDPDVPIVMIGAGTGVAPYRGFLAEREALGARGRNWLVFGDRSFELDFLYQAEWLAWRRQGLLSRLDVAFSRDQADKCYVQHRLIEQGALLWRWLDEGACLYLCGDATRMAPDVEDALAAIIGQHGGLDAEASREYLRQLRRDRRYQKDVY